MQVAKTMLRLIWAAQKQNSWRYSSVTFRMDRILSYITKKKLYTTAWQQQIIKINKKQKLESVADKNCVCSCWNCI